MLILAMRNGRDDIAGLLLDKRANPRLQDQFEKTAAMTALELGHTGMSALTFLECGVGWGSTSSRPTPRIVKMTEPSFR